MQPVPPFLPDSVSVPGNAADGDYNTRVGFTKRVGLWHLVSLALPVGLVSLCLRRDSLDLVAAVDPSVWLAVATSGLVGLGMLRNAPRLVQALVFVLMLVSAAPPLALWLGFMHDAFPLFVETAAKILAASWLGLASYNLLCGRDYSFVGEFFVSLLLPTAVSVWLTVATDLTFSEGLTLLVVAVLALFYWTYDLAMILRRRTAAQVFEAVIDLYRDVINWTSYPLLMLRAVKQRKKGVLRW